MVWQARFEGGTGAVQRSQSARALEEAAGLISRRLNIGHAVFGAVEANVAGDGVVLTVSLHYPAASTPRGIAQVNALDRAMKSIGQDVADAAAIGRPPDIVFDALETLVSASRAVDARGDPLAIATHYSTSQRSLGSPGVVPVSDLLLETTPRVYDRGVLDAYLRRA